MQPECLGHGVRSPRRHDRPPLRRENAGHGNPLPRTARPAFGADNYDQLMNSDTANVSSLGEHFAERGLWFDAVITGTLQRQRQSLIAITEGMGESAEGLEMPGLNEYDSTAVLATVHDMPLHKPASAEEYRALPPLREGRRWMDGSAQPAGMPSYRRLLGRRGGALDHVRTRHGDGHVLIVSSGGPISTAVGLILGTEPR